MPVGLSQMAQTYNTFVVSVLSFIQQIENVPERALCAEASALRKFAVGPGNWVMSGDLFHLRELFHLCCEFFTLGYQGVPKWGSKSTFQSRILIKSEPWSVQMEPGDEDSH